MTLILLVVIGAAVAGLIQGLAGFGFGLVAMAFWAWAVSPHLAGPMVVFGSLVGQILGIGSVKRGFDAARALPFIIGGVLGVPAGVILLQYIDATWFKFAVGALLVIYCPVMLFAADLPRVTAGGRFADGLAGVAGGVMGGLGGLTGPAPTLWCSLRGWGKDEQRAVFQSFNLTMAALTLATYALTGLLTRETTHMFLLVLPAMFIPTLIGTRLYTRFSDVAFRRLILVLLSLSGTVLLVATVPTLLHR